MKNKRSESALKRAEIMLGEGKSFYEISRLLNIPYSSLRYRLDSEFRGEAIKRAKDWLKTERGKEYQRRYRRERIVQDRKFAKRRAQIAADWYKRRRQAEIESELEGTVISTPKGNIVVSSTNPSWREEMRLYAYDRLMRIKSKLLRFRLAEKMRKAYGPLAVPTNEELGLARFVPRLTKEKRRR